MVNDDLGRMWVGTDGGMMLYDHEQDIFLDNNNIDSISIHFLSK